MSRFQASHPDDGDLLRYADSEVPTREARQIESHLAACRECHTRIEELQRTIGECVRYRQKVLQSCLPDPPAPWFDIYRRFADLDESRQPLSKRLWEMLRANAAQPRRWVMATALLVIAFVVVDQFRNAPSVRAAELLRQAVVAAESLPEAPRHIQIRTKTLRVDRAIGGLRSAAGSPEASLALAAIEPLFQAARYDWEDPLSAGAFAAWRNTLADKQDEVTTVEHPRLPGQACYLIRTTTESGELLEATLKLGVDGLRPVEGRLRFRHGGWVEITELAEAPAPLATPLETVVRTPSTPAPKTTEAEPLIPVAEPATPGDELEVLAALRRLDADLGEPVEVTREGQQVVVTGVGVNPDLGRQIQDELRAMPGVSVQFSDPLPGPLPAGRRAAERVSLPPEIARLQAELEEHLGGRASFEQFADEVLGLSETLMSHVHALRRLAERFQPEVESNLTADEMRLLWSLRREHAVAVAELAVALEERSRPALASLAAPAAESFPAMPLGDSWQAVTEVLFGEARRAESLLAAMLGGAVTQVRPEALPARVLSSLEHLRASSAGYVRHTLE